MSKRKPLTDEQLDAIWKEMLKPNSRKPLTLEELRSMDGKPVWVHVVDHTVFADKEDDFDGYGLVRKSWVRVWDEKRADLIYVDYDFCGYGKEWLAYDYEPPRLDRSAWKPCEYCGGKKTLYQKTIHTKLYMDTFGSASTLVTECSHCPPYSICCMKDIHANSAFKINFCPECGRPLIAAAWDMLERRLSHEYQ